MKIIVTGGAGFIGSHVAEHALGAGHEVAVIDDLSSGRRENVPKGAQFHELDICDADGVRRVFETFRPNAVCHQAAQASVTKSVRDPVRDAQVNILGSLNLLAEARKYGSRVVFASTGGAIYGEVPEGTRASLASPPAPFSPYACSKLAFEFYLRAQSGMYGFPHAVLRYANVYGPRQDPHGEAGVVAIFMQRMLAGEPVTVFARRTQGDDGCVRDYVFVWDVVRANMAALEGAFDGGILNVGTGAETTTRALANAILATHKVVPVMDGPPREGDLERSVLDPSDFIARFGSTTDLAAGLARTAEWFRAKHGA